MNKMVGVLAMQGAYQKHIDMLQACGARAKMVRYARELDGCDALIIPGGESTTISLLLQKSALYEPLRSFAQTHPVMGACAGMIMMAEAVDDARVTPLGIMPFRALRNHYGRQVHSFVTDISLNFDEGRPFPAVFIRAPGVEKLSADINVLAEYKGEPVMLEKDGHLALSFHPELTDDKRIHAWWLKHIHLGTL
ncbi:MAG TPA: pyridoxal 5'-phosphate synthase glutaminase subunit PdxT [Gammaproteobacteria bacterium]|nr:pyridoxal 5'-phosphate synthase glutaminase subunit PdxT [Gammaproteobacteria bacterium]